MNSLFPEYGIGHFINQPTNPTEFEILVFGEMDEPEVEDMHKHSFYEILWTESGISRQTIDYNEYEVLPHSLFFISPNQVHQFEEWQPLVGGTIMFTEHFFLLNQYDRDSLFELSFLDNLHSNPCLQMDSAAFAEVRSIIDLLVRENALPSRNLGILQHLLHALLLTVQRQIDRHAGQRPPRRKMVIFKEFRQLLEAQFDQNFSVSAYADQLSITQHHLNLVCRSIANKTATEVIRMRRVLEAKRLLTFTDWTVTEIAERLAFTDSSYFAKVFFAEVGQSPIEFRNKTSEKYRTK